MVALLFIGGRYLLPELHAWLLTSPSARVKKVAVSGNRFLTPREVITLAEIHPGMPMVTVRAGDAEARLTTHPRIRRADVNYRFPMSIRVDVQERFPIALIDGDPLTMLSPDGRVLPPVPGRRTEDLPLVVPPTAFRREGDAVRDPLIIDALHLLTMMREEAPELARRVSLVDLSGVRFARVYLDTLDVALLYEPCADWGGHIQALSAVIADLARENREGSVLDLRFREQIVRRGGDERRPLPRSG